MYVTQGCFGRGLEMSAGIVCSAPHATGKEALYAGDVASPKCRESSRWTKVPLDARKERPGRGATEPLGSRISSDAVSRGAEDVGDLATEERQSCDGDDGDQRQDQGVLGESLTSSSSNARVESDLHPGV